MVLSELSRIFEKRKMELYQLLNDRNEELKPETQHQMYGAMNEIDIFLETIQHYRHKEVDDEIKKLRLVGPIIKERKITKFFNNINDSLSNIRFKKQN
ncbi:hypothetical protein GOV05_02205 [Candidatus Woesearchaeota archaeon]|nr:hypothetical protein [Candidatus Woesearchaeota archaeon]